jgi:DNA modification methylase
MFSSDISILEADARQILQDFPADFFQTCITSPPYWGLRDYGIDGQIGAEVNLSDYINSLVTIFEEVRRVLKPDGTFWLNIGDSYTSGNRGWRAPDKKLPQRAMSYRPPTPEGLKSKDLIGIPWRVAFALQEVGWYLRSEIIWNKPNANPESVIDRPVRSHEHIFLLTKNEKYYYDREATKESSNGGTRYKRSVWSINTEPYKEAHFATFPPGLVEPCILAGSKSNDYILDPFMGSGTVGVVARILRRKFVGVEIKSEYIELAKRRIGFIYQMSFDEIK